MLIIITLNHTKGNPFTQYTWQPLGFFSAAEGFVFISGLLAGFVYGRASYSQKELRRKIIGRTKLIAIVWAVACAIILLKHSIYPISPDRYQGFLSTILLFPNPLDTDEILFMYMVLIFLLQFYLIGLRKGKWILVLTISAIPYGLLNLPELYIRTPNAVQSEFADSLIEALRQFRGVKGFSILAWQFLFAIAVTVGFYIRRKASFAWTLSPLVIVPTISIYLFQLFVDLSLIRMDFWEKFADRPSLGPTRLIAVLTFALIVSYLMRLNKYKTRVRPLEYLGKQSLYIYGYQAVIITIAINPWMSTATNNTQKAGILLTMVASLWLAAFVANKIIKMKKERDRLRKKKRPAANAAT